MRAERWCFDIYKPLADKIRPENLDDFVGQEHLIGSGGILRRILERGEVPNMIFYGPSGIGKTTLAGIIAAQTKRKLYKLNATTAALADIKSIVDELDTFLAPEGALLYLDEIQYFNKKQQQSLLEFIENGKITLIASTTENPYFYIYNAILSRSTVFEFKPISADDVAAAVRRAFALCAKEGHYKIALEDGVVLHISAACGGDVRKAINAVELLSTSAKKQEDGSFYVTLDDCKAVTQASAARYDRDGDSHYDILSCFHKSLRGSDPNAALYYLARLLCGGDIISCSRRMLACVCEDVGMAYPQAISIVKACIDSAHQLGLPEARLPLAQAAVLIATAPKSNSVAIAIDSAMAAAQSANYDLPVHLKDSHYPGAQKLGHGQTYQYPHDFKNNYITQQYLPTEIKNSVFYKEGTNKLEQQAHEYWAKIKEQK